MLRLKKPTVFDKIIQRLVQTFIPAKLRERLSRKYLPLKEALRRVIF